MVVLILVRYVLVGLLVLYLYWTIQCLLHVDIYAYLCYMYTVMNGRQRSARKVAVVTGIFA